MTTQQPEALRLSEILNSRWCEVWHQVAAAKELRRLHAENEALKQQISANKPTKHGLDKFINEVGEVNLLRFREKITREAVLWNAHFQRYGANVCGKTLQEAIEKAIASQAKQGEQA